MPAPPQTFRPSIAAGHHPISFLIFGAFLLGLVGYMDVMDGPPGQGWGLAALLACGPGLIFLGIGLDRTRTAGATKTVDDDGIWVKGPLGRRGVRWADVVGHDVLLRTEAQGVRLFLRDGGRFALPFLGHDDDGLYEAVHRHLDALPPPDVEGREFRQRGRWGASVGMLGSMAVLTVGVAMNPKNPGAAWIPFAMLVPVFLPLVLWGLTDRVVLKDGVLTKGSSFGRARLPLADVVEAELKVAYRSGMSETLVLNGPKGDITLEPRYDGYAMLRDAVIAGLRPSVRPRPSGEEVSVRPAVRLKVTSARPRAEIEGRVFRPEQFGPTVFVLSLVLLVIGFFGWLGAQSGNLGPAALSLVPAFLLVPMLAGAVSERAVLRGGTLTVFSGYRRQRIDLADVRRAELRTVTHGNVRRECLFLTGPDGRETEIPSRLADSDRLVDAVLARLPTSMTFTG